MSRRPNWEIVLRAMQKDIAVELDGHTFCLINDRLCMRLLSYKNEGGSLAFSEERWVASDLLFNSFIELCEVLSEDQIVNIVASTTMRSMENTPS